MSNTNERYERTDLEAYIGSERLDEYHIDEIEDEATTYDYDINARVWSVDDEDLATICQKWIKLEVLDDVNRDYDGYIINEGTSKCRQFKTLSEADEYVSSIDGCPMDEMEGITEREAYEIHEWPDGTWLEIHVVPRSDCDL